MAKASATYVDNKMCRFPHRIPSLSHLPFDPAPFLGLKRAIEVCVLNEGINKGHQVVAKGANLTNKTADDAVLDLRFNYTRLGCGWDALVGSHFLRVTQRSSAVWDVFSSAILAQLQELQRDKSKGHLLERALAARLRRREEIDRPG